MSITIIFIAVIGIVWLYISWVKFKANTKKAWAGTQNSPIGTRVTETFKTVKNDRFGIDLRISLLLVFAGTAIFIGVTGMVIALIASVAISATIQASKKSDWFRRLLGLPEDH